MFLLGIKSLIGIVVGGYYNLFSGLLVIRGNIPSCVSSFGWCVLGILGLRFGVKRLNPTIPGTLHLWEWDAEVGQLHASTHL